MLVLGAWTRSSRPVFGAWHRHFSSLSAQPRHFASSDGEHVKHVQLNQELLRCRNAHEVEQLVLHSNNFNAVNCATAASQLAKFSAQKKSRASTTGAALTRLYEMGSKNFFLPRALATFCHAIASGRLDDKIPGFVLKQLEMQNVEDDEFPFKNFTPQGLALVVWSYAKLDQADEFVFSRASREIALKRNLQEFDAQHLSNIVWSFARVRYESDAVFRKVALELERREWKGCEPQHISNIALAYAKMKQKRHIPLLFHNLSRTCLMQKPNSEFDRDFSYQALTILCYSFASMQHKDDELFLRIARTLLRRSSADWQREFNNQNIANLLWSFAKMGLSEEELFARCSALLQSRNDFSHPLTLASIVWSFAKLGVRDDKLFDRVALAVRNKALLEQFKTHEFCNLVWGFAKAERGKSDDLLLESFCSDLLYSRRIESFEPMDLADLFWSLTKLGAKLDSYLVMQKLYGEIKLRDLREFTTHELANIAWALETAAAAGAAGEKQGEFANEIQHALKERRSKI